jgi:hypothetical protein
MPVARVGNTETAAVRRLSRDAAASVALRPHFPRLAGIAGLLYIGLIKAPSLSRMYPCVTPFESM